MATTLTWQPLQLQPKTTLHIGRRRAATVQAFRRSDFDRFARRMTSGEAWRDAWRTANDGFEQLVFEAKKTAERIDRQYSVSRRLNSAARTAAVRARELDREFEISVRWRSFRMDFSRNWPRYRKQLNDFLNTPLGRSFATIFFLWFALSGWLFRILILATWVLPIAAPLLIGTVANNFVIKMAFSVLAVGIYCLIGMDVLLNEWQDMLTGACPACKREFIGSKSQIIRCAGCRNIVWQPEGDFFSRNGRGKKSTKSDDDIIDVEFEEK